MFDNEPTPMPAPTSPAGTPPIVQPGDIHTMPERFMDTGMSSQDSGSKGSGGRGKRMLMIAAISVGVVAVLGGGAWYYFTKIANKNDNTNVATVNTNRTNTNRANLNANLNTNTSLNLNTNSSFNANSNSNINSGTNQNSNTNTSGSTLGTPLPNSTDADSDGLTDVEEQVYGTSSTNSDTDGDGFIDGYRILANGKAEGEAYTGYCPTKKGSVRLDDATCGIVKTYTNDTFSYSLWIPLNWVAQATNSQDGGKTVVVTPNFATTEFFKVSVADNPTQLSAKNYYINLNPGADPSKIKDATVNGLDGVWSLDQSTVYFVKGTRAYILNYNTDTLTAANLNTTFLIMERSFHLASSSSSSNTNSGSANTNGTTTNSSNGNTNSPPIFN